MEKKQRIMSLSAVGPDSPGLLSRITTKIYELGGNIIDVEEHCRKGIFSIFLNIDFSGAAASRDAISEDLKGLEGETGLRIISASHGKGDLRPPAGKENHLVTILGADQPGIIMRVSTFFNDRGINIESCKMIAYGEIFSMEMLIDTRGLPVSAGGDRNEALEGMKAALKVLCTSLQQSVVIQSRDIYRKARKLVVFDVESTLIQDTSLSAFLEKIAGRIMAVNGESILSVTRGDTLQRLVEQARSLKGLPLEELEKFSGILELNPGSLELIGTLKSMGFKIALISSGFAFFVERIFKEAGVDYAFSNMPEVDERGILTGRLQDPVITPAGKEELLEFLMEVEKIGPDQIIGIGDGSSQSHFIKNTGLSIAFKPDQASIRTDGVLGGDAILRLLYCLGIPKEELDKHLNYSPAPVSHGPLRGNQETENAPEPI